MRFKLLIILCMSALLFSAAGCNNDKVDIIFQETIPEELMYYTSNDISEETIETEITEAVTLPTITFETIPRPQSINEQFLKEYDRYNLDTSFKPIEETEETVLAKRFVREMKWVVENIKDIDWRTSINLDEYMDDGYLKDYLEYMLDVEKRKPHASMYNYDFDQLEAVETKQIGDITYIGVRYFSQYNYGGSFRWSSDLWTEWVGIRNGRVVNQSIITEGIGETYDIHPDYYFINKNIYWTFNININPWESEESVKKIYDGLKAQGYDIEMQEH